MFKSMIWTFGGVFFTQITIFVTQIILSRYLPPEDFGQIALLLVFVAFCDVFVNGGFVTALIQKKDSDSVDFSTTVIFSLTIALLCYILLLLTSKWIAHFFEIDGFSIKLRILGIIIFPKVFLSIQTAYCKKQLEFKKLYIITILSNIISGGIAIVLAYYNYRIYALIWQQISFTIIISTLLIIFTNLKLRICFDKSRFYELFNFGWKIFSTDFLNFCFQNIRSIIVGKIYPLSSLGFFNRGSQYAGITTGTISTTLMTVLLPYLAREQDSEENSKKIIRETIQTTVLLVYPLLFGTIAIAKNLVIVLLTEKWLPCVIFIQIFALYGFWAKPQIVCQEALKARGLSNRTLEIEIIRKVLEFSILLVSVFLSLEAIALSAGIACLVSWFPVAYFAKKDLSYTYKEQMADCVPTFLASLAMGATVYLINYINLNPIMLLVIQVLVGAMEYLLLIFIFDIPGKERLINEVLKTKDHLKKKNKTLFN